MALLTKKQAPRLLTQLELKRDNLRHDEELSRQNASDYLDARMLALDDAAREARHGLAVDQAITILNEAGVNL